MLQKADVAEVLRAESQRARRGRRFRIAAGVAILLLVLGGAVAFWLNLQEPRTASFETTPAVRGDIAVILTATGTLEPTQQVAVSSLVTGTISAVDVDYNQQVTRGQVLARLDLRPFELQLRRAFAMVDAQAANRDAARATVRDAEASLRRTKGLPEGEIVSSERVELAETALQRTQATLAAAEAQLKAAEADLASARDNYGHAIMVAPIDGIILDVNAEVGQTINPAALASSLFVLASDIRQLELEVDIDEADIAQVEVGNPADFTVEALPNRPLHGVVKQVRTGPTISNGITSYKAIIAVDNRDLELRPGMTATADISTAEARDVLIVPNAALRFAASGDAPADLPPSDPGSPHLYVMRGGKPTPLPVRVGLSDGQHSAVEGDGLVMGDLVVTGRQGR